MFSIYLLFSIQGGLQPFLVVVAVASVPVMLLGRPLILRYRPKNGHLESPRYHKLDQNDDDGSFHGNGGGDEGRVELLHNDTDTSIHAEDEEEQIKEEPFDFGEVSNLCFEIYFLIRFIFICEPLLSSLKLLTFTFPCVKYL